MIPKRRNLISLIFIVNSIPGTVKMLGQSTSGGNENESSQYSVPGSQTER